MLNTALEFLRGEKRKLSLYARHFDRKWYRSQVPGQIVAQIFPLLHYAHNGWRRGLQPTRHFLPAWYLAQYKDVDMAGMEPFYHYLRYGCKEGRDPSPAFSTGWYVREYSDVATSNPLTHYNEAGFREGRRCHPLLDPPARQTKVGIVIVSHNGPKFLRATLKSISKALTTIPFKIFLVENGSQRIEKEQIRAFVDNGKALGLNIEYFDLDENLGFSGGNNIGIRAAISQSFTHICLLNSDVLVTDHWLDDLVKTEAPIVGPVSNAVGNEQTILPNYSMQIDSFRWNTANEFAKQWRDVLLPRIFHTEFLGFFCVVIRREVFDAIGELDEGFFPGSFEDDDFCERAKCAGFTLSVARHIYVHHFGSGSFSTLPMPERIRISDTNRNRFEEKYGRKWADRTHLLATSIAQDAIRLPRTIKRPELRLMKELLSSEAANIAELTSRLTAAVAHYQVELVKNLSQGRLAETDEPGESRSFKSQEAVAKSNILSLDGFSSDSLCVYFAMLRGALAANVEISEAPRYSTLLDLQPILAFLAEHLRGSPIVLIAANNNDPINGGESDGYLQRLRSIDYALTDCQRIYLRFDESYRGIPRARILDKGIFTLSIADDDLFGILLIRALLALSAHLYVHSVLPFASRSLRKVFEHVKGYSFIDVHGAVPEEFILHHDYFSAQIFGKYEHTFFRKTNFIICVTQAMAEHLHIKYGIDRGRIIICPIFLQFGSPAGPKRTTNTRPRVVYAGGTQVWQQIPKMLDAIVARRNEVDFTIFTPTPDLVITEFEKRGMVRAELKAHVRCASQKQVLSLYQLSDFGFLLRQQSIVNKVACPTKLIEYIECGVIPILDTAEIGDFSKLGLRYVSVVDFYSGNLPDRVAREEMARVNHTIADQLREASQAGRQRLLSLLRTSGGQLVTSKKHSVGIVVPAFDKGGLEQVAFNLYKEYKKAGHSCLIMIEKNEAGYMWSLVPPVDLIIFNGDEEIFIRTCVARDITLLHYQYGTFALAATSKLGIYTIYTLHNVYTWLDDETFANHAANVAHANRIVAVSVQVKEYFCSRAKLPEYRVDVIPNGIDVNGLLQGSVSDRSSLGIPERTFIFAHIASFHRVKHHAIVVRAAEELAANGASFHLLFVGNIADRDYYNEIISLISNSPAKDRIVIIDYVPRDRVSSLYKNIDCVLLPSLQEGCSNVILEALLFQRPTIATDVGNVCEVRDLFHSIKVIPSTHPMMTLNSESIMQLSRTTDTNNLRALVNAMEEMLKSFGARKSGARRGHHKGRTKGRCNSDGPSSTDTNLPAGTKKTLSTEMMARSYLSLFPQLR